MQASGRPAQILDNNSLVPLPVCSEVGNERIRKLEKLHDFHKFNIEI